MTTEHEPIESLLNLTQFTQGRQAIAGQDISQEGLEFSAAMYAMLHDVVHWLLTDYTGFQQFHENMASAFEEKNVPVPDEDVVGANLQTLHTVLKDVLDSFENEFGIHHTNLGDIDGEQR